MNIQEFFKDAYVIAGTVEVVHCDVPTDDENAVVYLWANRLKSSEHWTVTVELHERHENENWAIEFDAVGMLTDAELMGFVHNFSNLHYYEYFPLLQIADEDDADEEDWDDELAEFLDNGPDKLLEEITCDLHQCAYNNGGECRYDDVFDKKPNFDGDNCKNFVLVS